MILLALLAGILLGYFACLANPFKKDKILTLTDTYTPNPNRSANQQANDDVLRLQNEIAKSGAVKRREVGNGHVEVTIKVKR